MLLIKLLLIVILLAALALIGDTPACPYAAVAISLPQHRARFDAFQARARRQGVHVARFDALNGHALPLPKPPFLTPKYRRHFAGAPGQRGHLGAAFSHIGVWRAAGPLLIFEDDVSLVRGFHGKLTAALAAATRIDPGWDLLLLGFSCAYRDYERCHRNDGLPRLAGGLVEVKTWMGLWGYVVNGDRARRKLLQHVFPLKWHLDHHLATLVHRHGLRVYGTLPSLVLHPGTMVADSWQYSVTASSANYTSDTTGHRPTSWGRRRPRGSAQRCPRRGGGSRE